MQHLELKQEFIERYKNLTNFKEFSKYLDKFLRRSIRVNTLKISIKGLKERLKDWRLEQIPWCKEGFWIEGERRDIGNLVEHRLGYFFIQGAASMIPPLVLNPKENDLVLDMCASPGSKTTQIAQLMKNKGIIIANDKLYQRMKPLGLNLQRCGVTNTIITLMDGRNLKGNYDKILVDAPCSASGRIRGLNNTSIKTAKTWKLNTIKSLAGLQKVLLLKAYDLLKSKGTLVYSTCTLEPEEDEAVIQHILDNTDLKLEKINLKIKSKVNLDFDNYDKKLKNCIKLWPQFYDTEGFFIAKFKN